jgi:hypothetical protein
MIADGTNGKQPHNSPERRILIAAAPLREPKGRTDANNAIRLAVTHGDVIVWVGPWDKWLIWDGTRWKPDDALAINAKAKEVAAELFLEIAILHKERRS